MYHRALYDILMESGHAIAELTREMQDEDELFGSRLTLRAVEAHLLIMAQTVANLPPPLHRRLLQVDWRGWDALHLQLRHPLPRRREPLWYAVNALVPQTLGLIADLRRRQPQLFPSDC